MANIFAFAETRLGELRRAGLEAVTAARRVADETGGQVHAMLAGGPGIGAIAAKLNYVSMPKNVSNMVQESWKNNVTTK